MDSFSRWLPAPLLTIMVLAGVARLGAQDEVRTFKRYNLRCLAPLLENLDAEAPKTLEEALLAGPSGSLKSRVNDKRIGAGAIHFPIETDVPEAQVAFNRGIALLHTLWYREAARAFRTVVHLEPNHAMGYWGLAMANELRPGRAKVFSQAAVDRVDANRPALERRWVGILGDFYGVSSRQGGAPRSGLKQRSAERIRALEDLVVDYPDELEAKAFMLRQLVLDQYRAGVEVTSRLGVEQLVEQLTALAPDHPSTHYGSFLWLGTRPDRGVEFGLRATGKAPGVADVWRYAAESMVGAARSNEALTCYEAALRVDQQYLMEHQLMPWEAQNFVSNYRSLVTTLIGMGRIDEAIKWAMQMTRFPKQSVSNEAVTADGMADQGLDLWIQALMESGDWKRLSESIESGGLGEVASGFPARTRVQFWRGISGLFLEGPGGAGVALNQLKALHREAISKGVSNRVEQGLVTAQKSLRIVEALFESETPQPIVVATREGWLSVPLLVATYERVGLTKEAWRLADGEAKAHPDHVLKVAKVVTLAFDTNKRREAFLRLDRKFRALAGMADEALPVLDRLEPVIREMQLPQPWVLPMPASKPAVALDQLGPASWEAPKVEVFALKDAQGNRRELREFSGKPLVLNFFLGVQCGYCLEQLGVFKPHLETFRSAGIEFVAISSDPVEVLSDRLQLQAGRSYDPAGEFPFLILADPDLEVFRQLGSFDEFEDGPLHATVVLDGEGRLLWADRGHAPFKRPQALLAEIQRLMEVSNFQKPNH